MREPSSNDNPVATSTPSTQTLVSNTNRRNEGSLEKWLILGMGQEICKMNLDHLVLPESKEVLKNKEIKNQCNDDGGISKGHRRQLNELPLAKSRTI